MVNTFRRKISSNVSNTFTTVGSYTVGSATQTTVIGLSIANKATNQILVDVTLDNGSSNTYLINGAPVPSGGAIVVVGGDQKVVMETNDKIQVRTDTAGNTADVIMSILEIT
jgi:hypothetical protein